MFRVFGNSPMKSSQGLDSVENEAPGRVPLGLIHSSSPHGNRGKRAQFNLLLENGNATPDKRTAATKANKFGWPQQEREQQSRDEEQTEQLTATNTPSRVLGSQSLQPGSKHGGSGQFSTPRASRIDNKHWQMLSEPGGNSTIDNATPKKGVSRSLKYNQESALVRTGLPKPQGKQVVENLTPGHYDLVGDSSFWQDHNVQVLIRIRPLSASEVGSNRSLRQDTSHSLTWVGPPESRFTFDHVACETISQETLFTVAGLPMVENCISGYNNCMFAYGQTGSGKTHTMLGDISELDQKQSEDRGMIPRVFEYLFEKVAKEELNRASEKLRFVCKCSFLEIYNEQITDLLEPSSTNLQLREDGKKGVYVDSLTEVEVKNVQDVIKLLLQGSANRKVAATNMNRESSRSHSVFTCVVESKWERDSVINTRFGRLNLVDLAGSERQKSSGAEGDRLKEAANINKSLSTLGLVIMVLVDAANGKPRHVPYRDSKLTFLLQDSLGGNSKTLIIATVNPSSSCALETLSTLKFAQRAKFIRNNAIINEDTFGDVLALRQQIQQLKEELNYYQTRGFSKRLVSDHTEDESNILSTLGRDILAGSLRREAAAEAAVKDMAVEMELLNKLARQREEDTQRLKMLLRFREDKIRRMEGITEGLVSADEYLLEEKNSLMDEIKLLRHRIDHNPEVTRFAMENIRLLNELKRCQEFIDNSERELVSVELANLRDQLVEILNSAPSREEHLKLVHDNETLRSESSKYKEDAEEQRSTFCKRIQELEELVQRQSNESCCLKQELELANHKLCALEAEQEAQMNTVSGLKLLLRQSEEARAAEEAKSAGLLTQLTDALETIKALDANLKEEAGIQELLEGQGLLLMKELEVLQNERSDVAFVMLKHFSDVTEKLKVQVTAEKQANEQQSLNLAAAERNCVSMVDALKLAETQSSKLKEELTVLQASLERLATESLDKSASDKQLRMLLETQSSEILTLRNELRQLEETTVSFEADFDGTKEVVEGKCFELASLARSFVAEEFSTLKFCREKLLTCTEDLLERNQALENKNAATQRELQMVAADRRALTVALKQSECRGQEVLVAKEAAVALIDDLRGDIAAKEKQILQVISEAEALRKCLVAAEYRAKIATCTEEEYSSAIELLGGVEQDMWDAKGFVAESFGSFLSEAAADINNFKVGVRNIIDELKGNMLATTVNAVSNFKLQEQEASSELYNLRNAVRNAEEELSSCQQKNAELSIECLSLGEALHQSEKREKDTVAAQQAAQALVKELRVRSVAQEEEIDRLKSFVNDVQSDLSTAEARANNAESAFEDLASIQSGLLAVVEKEVQDMKQSLDHYFLTLSAETISSSNAFKAEVRTIIASAKRDLLQTMENTLDQVSRSTKKASELEAHVATTKFTLGAAMEAESRLLAELNEVKLKYQLLQQEAEANHLKLQQSMHTISEFEALNTKLLADFRRSEDKCQMVEKDCTAAVSEMSDLDVKIQQLYEHLTLLEQENGSLVKEKENQATVIAALEGKLAEHAVSLEKSKDIEENSLKLQEELDEKSHEMEEKQRIIESLDAEMIDLSSLVEQKISDAVRDLNYAAREKDQLQADLLVLSEQLEMAQALADERELVAAEARQVAEASKAHAEEKDEEVRFLERSVGELESTINALENQGGIMKREAQMQRLLREDLELQVQTLKHQIAIKDADTSNSQGEALLSLKEEIVKLTEDCMEKDAQIQAYKKHIGDLMTASTRQASQHQQKITELETSIEQARSAKPKGSNSPFKCMGLGLTQQINSEKDEELSAARRRICELESTVSARQTEVYMLNSRLAEAESMTHDVVRDLLGVKMDITNYASLLTSRSNSELLRSKTQEADATQLLKRLEDFTAERESLLEEIKHHQTELASVRVAADNFRQRDERLSAENEKLRDENSAVKKHQLELESEVRKLSGQQNLQQRIHHHAKIKDENNALKVRNEELCSKLKRLESRFNRVNEELSRHRDAHPD